MAYPFRFYHLRFHEDGWLALHPRKVQQRTAEREEKVRIAAQLVQILLVQKPFKLNCLMLLVASLWPGGKLFRTYSASNYELTNRPLALLTTKLSLTCVLFRVYSRLLSTGWSVDIPSPAVPSATELLIAAERQQQHHHQTATRV